MARRTTPPAEGAATATPHEVALLRLAAQHIAGPGLPGPAEVVRRLTAVQAQDPAGVVTSVALRAAAGTRQAVESAFDAGEIVKSWPMRGTLHLVVAEDLPWILGLTAPRILASAAARRAELGLDAPTLERARRLAVDALAGGNRLRRDELLAAWREGGLDTTGQRGYHMVGNLAQTGTLCFGPVRDGEQLLVLVEEWIPRPRRLEREEALGELALRYFTGHGPATVKDFTRWTSLLAADVRAGLALARPRLARLDVGGVEHLMAPETPALLDACRDRARGVFLLPGFDEFILGYQDRGAVLAAEFADRIVPGGNGVFRPTVVADGRVLGTWKHTGRGAKRTIEATPFESFPDEVTEAIAGLYVALP
ncbi:winged helix DNA-binding domain-containing protein [Planobispora longispora]|uniref:Winged helix DNA-binding domain-containing protein n=1 Tax=Planobispora longispora TaxID=28887 RepID=A0A8J3RSJ0_9ACTN|nr:winged helix DNA-binding domain-containing protein [Planobispora longispora]BFE79016.1 crosslink repair DNA glycosylase YcaQ family protein [Planobispora longispora]GIH80520.1 hypothetical protein Plo01_69490 [Planobispora longispora]